MGQGLSGGDTATALGTQRRQSPLNGLVDRLNIRQKQAQHGRRSCLDEGKGVLQAVAAVTGCAVEVRFPDGGSGGGAAVNGGAAAGAASGVQPSVPVGAIVGGVTGAVVLLILIILLVVVMMRQG